MSTTFQENHPQRLSGNNLPDNAQDLSQKASDLYWIQHALTLAKQAVERGEVPIGAVIVDANQQILAETANTPIEHNDPTAHAEVLALRQAGKTLDNYRLLDTTLYVTLEPCAMCVGAMVHARIKRLVFGAWDPKSGVVESTMKLLNAPHFNHKITWDGGVLEQACSTLLKTFFANRRR